MPKPIVCIIMVILALQTLAWTPPLQAAPSKAKYTLCLESCLSKRDFTPGQALSCVESCAHQTRTPAAVTIKDKAGDCYRKYEAAKFACKDPVCMGKARQTFIECMGGKLY